MDPPSTRENENDKDATASADGDADALAKAVKSSKSAEKLVKQLQSRDGKAVKAATEPETHTEA